MWSLRSSIFEAARNLRPVHLLLTAVIAAALALGGNLERTSVDLVHADYQRWISSGGMLFSVESDDSGIDGSECDARTSWPLVVGSGAAGLSRRSASIGLQESTSPLSR